MNRIEYKTDIHNSKKINFLNFLNKKKFKVLFKDRIVNSIYFDNENLEMYHDSIEGLCPRKKIRLRYYGDKKIIKKSEVFLEKKYTNFNGRAKKSEKINNYSDIMKNGLLDRKYGLCYPKTLVNYLRSYYIVDNYRITLDRNINFYSLKKMKSKFFKNSIDQTIVEIKNDNIKNLNEIKKTFPFDEIRFSKYCKSIENLI